MAQQELATTIAELPGAIKKLQQAKKLPASSRVRLIWDDQAEPKKGNIKNLLDDIASLRSKTSEREAYNHIKSLDRDFQINAKFLFEDIEKSGGISPQAAQEMDKNSKQFREEFWLDK